MAEDGDVPAGRYGGRGCAGACGDEFLRASGRASDERQDVALAPFIAQMLEKKWLGDKARQGFYKKERGTSRAGCKVWCSTGRRWSMGRARGRSSRRLRWRRMWKVDAEAGGAACLHGDATKDKAAAFYWPLLTELFTYAANRVPPVANSIADSIVEIDLAMETGFNWDAGAVRDVRRGWREGDDGEDAGGGACRCRRMWRSCLASGGENWYKDDASSGFRAAVFRSGNRRVQAGAGVRRGSLRSG